MSGLMSLCSNSNIWLGAVCGFVATRSANYLPPFAKENLQVLETMADNFAKKPGAERRAELYVRAGKILGLAMTVFSGAALGLIRSYSEKMNELQSCLAYTTAITVGCLGVVTTRAGIELEKVVKEKYPAPLPRASAPRPNGPQLITVQPRGRR